MRWRAVRSSAGRSLAPVARIAHELPARIADCAHSCRLEVGARVRQLLTTCGEAARLLVETISVSAGAARENLRSLVLLRRLHVRRAAVIYSTGCAALSSEDRRFEQARAELRMIDDLITAAGGRTAPAVRPAQSAAAAPADVPTEESVLMSPATSAVPALRRGR
jgi:hypothetical protein